MDENEVAAGSFPVPEHPSPIGGEHHTVGVDEHLAEWLSQMIHGSPVSRDTDAYNYLVTTALPDLARRFKGSV